MTEEKQKTDWDFFLVLSKVEFTCPNVNSSAKKTNIRMTFSSQRLSYRAHSLQTSCIED